jgi:hypothetical protein
MLFRDALKEEVTKWDRTKGDDPFSVSLFAFYRFHPLLLLPCGDSTVGVRLPLLILYVRPERGAFP